MHSISSLMLYWRYPFIQSVDSTQMVLKQELVEARFAAEIQNEVLLFGEQCVQSHVGGLPL